MPLKIESIAHDKLIWNLKSDVIRFDRLDATVGLIKQRADFNRSRIPALQQFDKACQSPSRVNDVFNYQNVSSLDGNVQILDDFDLS